ncbi:hypothetical protein B0H13DRAFT_2404115 [Mycena leptocephala]|nr:hypothetical protein B0H13DRAFT_2404115 [Mycena leptocephala]
MYVRTSVQTCTTSCSETRRRKGERETSSFSPACGCPSAQGSPNYGALRESACAMQRVRVSRAAWRPVAELRGIFEHGWPPVATVAKCATRNGCRGRCNRRASLYGGVYRVGVEVTKIEGSQSREAEKATWARGTLSHLLQTPGEGGVVMGLPRRTARSANAGAAHALGGTGRTLGVHGGRELRAAGERCAGHGHGGRGGDIGGGERECGWGEWVMKGEGYGREYVVGEGVWIPAAHPVTDVRTLDTTAPAPKYGTEINAGDALLVLSIDEKEAQGGSYSSDVMRRALVVVVAAWALEVGRRIVKRALRSSGKRGGASQRATWRRCSDHRRGVDGRVSAARPERTGACALGRQEQRAVWAQGGAHAGNVTADGWGRGRGEEAVFNNCALGLEFVRGVGINSRIHLRLKFRVEGDGQISSWWDQGVGWQGGGGEGRLKGSWREYKNPKTESKYWDYSGSFTWVVQWALPRQG